MSGLILKDIYCIKKQFKTYLVIFLFYGAITVFMENVSFMTIFIMVMLSMLPITTFSYDDFCKWDVYQLSLPVRRSTAVASKYLLALMILVIGGLISGGLTLLFHLLGRTGSASPFELLCYVGGSFASGILINAVILPLIYRFGPEKSRIMLFGVLGIPTVLIILLGKYYAALPFSISITAEQIKTAVLFLPLAVLLLFFGSFAISVKIYSRKEF